MSDLGIKTHMHLLTTIIFSIDYVIVIPTSTYQNYPGSWQDCLTFTIVFLSQKKFEYTSSNSNIEFNLLGREQKQNGFHFPWKMMMDSLLTGNTTHCCVCPLSYYDIWTKGVLSLLNSKEVKFVTFTKELWQMNKNLISFQ